MARLVTSATDILLWEATGLEPAAEEREASGTATDDLRSAASASTPAAGFGPETHILLPLDAQAATGVATILIP